MKELPRFKARNREAVLDFIAEVLTNRQRPDQTCLVELVAYRDGHYRAIFDPAYFVLLEGQQQPSKSQWNSLKKKMKRRDRRVFIFKEHGEVPCPRDHGGAGRCYYLDFGFFAG